MMVLADTTIKIMGTISTCSVALRQIDLEMMRIASEVEKYRLSLSAENERYAMRADIIRKQIESFNRICEKMIDAALNMNDFEKQMIIIDKVNVCIQQITQLTAGLL